MAENGTIWKNTDISFLPRGHQLRIHLLADYFQVVTISFQGKGQFFGGPVHGNFGPCTEKM